MFNLFIKPASIFFNFFYLFNFYNFFMKNNAIHEMNRIPNFEMKNKLIYL